MKFHVVVSDPVDCFENVFYVFDVGNVVICVDILMLLFDVVAKLLSDVGKLLVV